MIIRAFVLPECQTCKELKEDLQKKNIPVIYENPRDSHNAKIAKDLDKIFECNHYPKIVIETKENIVYIVPILCKKLQPIGNNLFFHWTTIESINNIINQFYEK
jgi:glutaredoxin